jgi:hypothetical protein
MKPYYYIEWCEFHNSYTLLYNGLYFNTLYVNGKNSSDFSSLESSILLDMVFFCKGD